MILRSQAGRQREGDLKSKAGWATELQTKRRKKKNWDVFLFYLECEEQLGGRGEAVRASRENSEAQTRFALGNHIYITNTNGEGLI